MIKVTGLWQHTSKKDEKYLSGKVGGLKILIFRNGFKKEGTNQPDFYLHVAGVEKSKDFPADDFDEGGVQHIND